MAQYAVGHTARVARIRSLIAQMPGLALAGNAYSGIGVPDCVRTGQEAVEVTWVVAGQVESEGQMLSAVAVPASVIWGQSAAVVVIVTGRTQLAPGATLHFALCSLQTARELRLDAKQRLDAALRSIAWEYGA